jgi:tRNA(Ile)-lysidine synthase
MKPRLSVFAKSLLTQWQQLNLPVADASVVVAVSGGADSTALLLGLDELINSEKLRLTLTVAHLDHGLRADSRADARWVSQLAKELGHKAVTGKANLKQKMSKPRENLEEAARKSRYEFLRKTAAKAHSELVLTAHTLDDQAETILLRLLRGSAAEGLGGTQPVREIERGSKVKLARPLLSWARRQDTEDYCRLQQIDFRVDEMNHDEAFARVRVRKQLLPLMKSFNRRVVEALSRTAMLLSEDAVALSAEAARLLESASNIPEQPGRTQPSRTPTVREGNVRQKTALANARGSARTATPTVSEGNVRQKTALANARGSAGHTLDNARGSTGTTTGRTPTVRKSNVRQKTALANARGSAWRGSAGIVTNSETKPSPLSVSVLLQSPAAVRRRALREWILRARGNLNRLEMVHLVAVEALLQGERGGRVAELPGGMTVTRKRGLLELSHKKELKKGSATSKIPRG